MYIIHIGRGRERAKKGDINDTNDKLLVHSLETLADRYNFSTTFRSPGLSLLGTVVFILAYFHFVLSVLRPGLGEWAILFMTQGLVQSLHLVVHLMKVSQSWSLGLDLQKRPRGNGSLSWAWRRRGFKLVSRRSLALITGDCAVKTSRGGHAVGSQEKFWRTERGDKCRMGWDGDLRQGMWV